MQRLRFAMFSQLYAARTPLFYQKIQVSKVPYTTSSTNVTERQTFLPTWEPGSGFYGRNYGIYTKQFIDYIQPTILNQLASVPVHSPRSVFSMAEFGASDGFVSMELVTRVIEQLRRIHGDQLAIQVIYNDQEKGDFNSLFKVINSQDSYQFSFSNVYPLAVSRDFYRRCLPDSFCDVVVSFLGPHFLQHEMTLKDSIVSSLSIIPEEIRLSRERAEQDWQTFLINRTQELKSGGLLIVSQFYRSHDRKYNIIDHMFSALNRQWKNARNEGIISQQEYEEFNFPLTFRSAEDIVAPLQDPNNLVHKAGLRLIMHDARKGPNYFLLPHEKKDIIHIRKVFADRVVFGLRHFIVASNIRHALRRRDAGEGEAVKDQIFKGVNKAMMEMDNQTYENLHSDISYLIAQKV